MYFELCYDYRKFNISLMGDYKVRECVKEFKTFDSLTDYINICIGRYSYFRINYIRWTFKKVRKGVENV